MRGEICFYGTAATGAGYLANTEADPGRFYGTGDPVPGRSFTEALFVALDQLRGAGVTGAVRVFAAGGQRMAEIPATFAGYYGDLKWGPAPVYEIPVEELTRAAAVS